MYSSIMSGAVHGIDSYLMQVETDISDGLPSFNMVGFMSSEVGISIRDLDLLTIGLVLDMWTEKANDGVKYRRIADQSDFDKF